VQVSFIIFCEAYACFSNITVVSMKYYEHPREHMPCLDGLRGFAAVLVLLGHANDFGLPSLIFPGAKDYGVLIFFALSGFLMGELYLSKNYSAAQVCDYLASRAARIVPIYYFIVFASFIIYRYVDAGFVYDVTPVQLLRLLSFNGSVSVFWSIGPEVQFYFLFIGLWFLFARFESPWVCVGVTLAISVFCLATIKYWPGTIVFSKFHIFACGMLLALLRKHVLPMPGPRVAAAMHIVGVPVLVALAMSESFFDLFGFVQDIKIDPTYSTFYGSIPRLLLAAFLVLCFSYNSRVGAFFLANPVAAFLGRCSFSIYLMHVAIFYCLAHSSLSTILPPLAQTLFVLGASIAAAAISYAVIEAPARKWTKRGIMALAEPGVQRLAAHSA